MSGNIITDIILKSSLPIIYLKVSVTRKYVKKSGSVSLISIIFPFSIIIASQGLKVGGVFQGQITR